MWLKKTKQRKTRITNKKNKKHNGLTFQHNKKLSPGCLVVCVHVHEITRYQMIWLNDQQHSTYLYSTISDPKDKHILQKVVLIIQKNNKLFIHSFSRWRLYIYVCATTTSKHFSWKASHCMPNIKLTTSTATSLTDIQSTSANSKTQGNKKFVRITGSYQRKLKYGSN